MPRIDLTHLCPYSLVAPLACALVACSRAPATVPQLTAAPEIINCQALTEPLGGRRTVEITADSAAFALGIALRLVVDSAADERGDWAFELRGPRAAASHGGPAALTGGRCEVRGPALAGAAVLRARSSERVRVVLRSPGGGTSGAAEAGPGQEAHVSIVGPRPPGS